MLDILNNNISNNPLEYNDIIEKIDYCKIGKNKFPPYDTVKIELNNTYDWKIILYKTLDGIYIRTLDYIDQNLFFDYAYFSRKFRDSKPSFWLDTNNVSVSESMVELISKLFNLKIVKTSEITLEIPWLIHKDDNV